MAVDDGMSTNRSNTKLMRVRFSTLRAMSDVCEVFGAVGSTNHQLRCWHEQNMLVRRLALLAITRSMCVLNRSITWAVA